VLELARKCGTGIVHQTVSWSPLLYPDRCPDNKQVSKQERVSYRLLMPGIVAGR
jgi:hypothetical protein